MPGACAAVAALSVSGLPSDRFLFVGFLARKRKKRTEVLQGLKSKGMTLIFYESPHRLLRTLADLISVMGDRNAVVARELTKYHEEVIRGSLSEIVATLSDRDRIRGECTLLVEGRKEKEFKSDGLVVDELERLAKEGSVSVKDAVRTVAGRHGISRGRVYREALRLWASRP